MNLEKLREELIRDEGWRGKPYRCTSGKITIGVGRNLDDNGLSNEEVEMLLENDIARVESELDNGLAWWRSLSDTRQRALANMCFQLGFTGLCGFKKMLRALEAGDYETAADEALDSLWAEQTPERANRIATMIREG